MLWSSIRSDLIARLTSANVAMAAQEEDVAAPAVEAEEDLVDYEEDLPNANADLPNEAAGKDTVGGGVKTSGYAGIHSSGFKDFLLKPELLRAVADCGFEHPSEGT